MDGKVAGMYDLEETLGSGHFAVVKLARHVFTGERVAVKVIDKLRLDKVSRDHLFQEVRCMKLVQHPSVIRLYQVIDTQTKLYLILELGEGGDLYEYIQKHENGVGEDEARDIFRQLVGAIAYCHKLHVAHRDLKPENVVFCQNGRSVKLTDFGLSNKFAPGEKLKTSCGSLSYSAPEILLGDHYDAPSVDVWSLGVILYMLLVGEKPFLGGTDSETLTMIMDCKFGIPESLSDDSKDLIQKMLVSESSERISVQGILDHPWMQTGNTNVSKPDEPLLIREGKVTPELHTKIIEKMVEGEFAETEVILKALESDTYDHITATYYLMAEAHLRQTRQDTDADKETHLIQRRRLMRKLSQPDVFSNALLPSPTADKTPTLSPDELRSPMRPGSQLLSPSQHGSMRRIGAAESGVLRRRTNTLGAARTLASATPPVDSPSRSPLVTRRRVQSVADVRSADISSTQMSRTLLMPLSLSTSPSSDVTQGLGEERPVPPSSLQLEMSVSPTRELNSFEEEEEDDEEASSSEEEEKSAPQVFSTSPSTHAMYPNWLTSASRRRRIVSDFHGSRQSADMPSSLTDGLTETLSHQCIVSASIDDFRLIESREGVDSARDSTASPRRDSSQSGQKLERMSSAPPAYDVEASSPESLKRTSAPSECGSAIPIPGCGRSASLSPPSPCFIATEASPNYLKKGLGHRSVTPLRSDDKSLGVRFADSPLDLPAANANTSMPLASLTKERSKSEDCPEANTNDCLERNADDPGDSSRSSSSDPDVTLTESSVTLVENVSSTLCVAKMPSSHSTSTITEKLSSQSITTATDCDKPLTMPVYIERHANDCLEPNANCSERDVVVCRKLNTTDCGDMPPNDSTDRAVELSESSARLIKKTPSTLCVANTSPSNSMSTVTETLSSHSIATATDHDRLLSSPVYIANMADAPAACCSIV